MIKKLIILGLLIWALVFFYNKFMADTMGGICSMEPRNFFNTSSRAGREGGETMD